MKPKKNENGAPASAGTASAGTDAAGKPSAAAVICAAGRSSRMGGIKKEYRRLPGRDITVLGAAVSAFAAVPGIQTIVIAVPAGHQSGEARNALPQRFLSGENGPAVRFVTGAETRRASVFNALSFLSGGSPPDIVLIHDGARPWLSPSLVERVIAGAGKYGAVIPLVPLADTPKETDLPLDSPGGAPVFVKRHLRRAFTGAAQTPQGFAFPRILAAHEKAAMELERGECSDEFTDDAEVWAAFFGPVAVIPGEIENKKITFPGDLL